MDTASTTETLLQDLRALGIQPGSMLEVHSSYKAWARCRAVPTRRRPDVCTGEGLVQNTGSSL